MPDIPPIDKTEDVPVLILRNISVILDVALVFSSSLRSMKPLFLFLFVALTVAVYADPYVVPHAPVPTRPAEMPVPISERMVIPATYMVEKPTEKSIVLPKPLAPLLPLQEEQKRPETVRGQTRTVDRLAELLDSPLPLAQGAVEAETIDSKLIDTIESSESSIDESGRYIFPAGSAMPGTKSVDPLGDGVLLMFMVITAIGLVYMVFVAFDYRQRWMQSLTTQNDRYLGGGGFEFDTEDTYGSPVVFSEGFGLTRRSSI